VSLAQVREAIESLSAPEQRIAIPFDGVPGPDFDALHNVKGFKAVAGQVGKTDQGREMSIPAWNSQDPAQQFLHPRLVAVANGNGHGRRTIY